MFALIQHLEPKERAILFQALNCFRQDAETMLAESYSENINHAQRQPMKWLADNSKQLQQKLFAECFPEDLEPLDHFIKEQKLLQATAQEAEG